MSAHIFAIVLCVIVFAAMVWLLRSRALREKYAILWMVVALGLIIFAAFPGLAFAIARLFGVESPVNVLFAVAATTLLIVVVQLSMGVSALEERVRTLTEELSLLRLEVAQATESEPESVSQVRGVRPVESDQPTSDDAPTSGSSD